MDKCILVIENNEERVQSLKAHLRRYRRSIRLARNGEEGLWRAATEIPDMVIAGVDIPFVDGWEVCRELKDNPETRGIPVVLVAGAVREREYAKSVLAKSDGIVAWPFDAVKMRRVIDRIVYGVN